MTCIHAHACAHADIPTYIHTACTYIINCQKCTYIWLYAHMSMWTHSLNSEFQSWCRSSPMWKPWSLVQSRWFAVSKPLRDHPWGTVAVEVPRKISSHNYRVVQQRQPAATATKHQHFQLKDLKDWAACQHQLTGGCSPKFCPCLVGDVPRVLVLAPWLSLKSSGPGDATDVTTGVRSGATPCSPRGGDDGQSSTYNL